MFGKIPVSKSRMNKGIFIIGTHCASLKDERLLISLVEKIHSAGYDYIVVSHSEVPPSVYKNSRYFSYDSLNSKNLNCSSVLWYANSFFKLYSPFLNGSIFGHADAALDLLLNGILSAKRLGYKIAHWIEYDSSIEDFEEVFENEREVSMEESDCIFYETSSDIYPVRGNFFTFNLEKIDQSEIFISYSEKLSRMENCHFSSEFYIKNFLMNGLRKKIKGVSENFPKSHSEDQSIKNWVLVENPDTGSLQLFLHNQTSIDWQVKIYTNHFSKPYTISPHQWILDTLGEFNFFSIKLSENQILDFNLSDPTVYQKIISVNRIEYFKN